MSYEFKQRELKFRAWNEEDMVYSWNYNEIYEFFQMNQNTEIMQWTGLKDRNGKDIYEGDIVGNDNSENMVAVFDDGCFGNLHAHSGIMRFAQDRCDRLSVIGNVFENPDLIQTATT